MKKLIDINNEEKVHLLAEKSDTHENNVKSGLQPALRLFNFTLFSSHVSVAKLKSFIGIFHKFSSLLYKF